jgi:hypothetical protein
MGVVSPPNDSVPQAALTRCLRELPNYVVLRNEEDLFGNLQRGGDVDLLVGDLELAERTLIRHLGAPIRIIRSSYVSGYSYDWGHVDLLPTIEWRGACYLRTEAVLEGRRLSPRGRPVPRIAHEALISWLTNLLWGGFFKDRYAAEIRQAVEIDGSAFRQTLMEVAGKKLGLRLWQAAVDGHAEISAEWTRSLRRAVWWRACLRSPVRTIQRSVAFVIGELRLRFQPPVPWMAILGPAGSGESYLANEIVHRFAACPYGNVKAVHWRSRLMAGAQGDEPVTDLHERPSRGPIGSSWRLLVLAADWLVCYWARWARLRAKGYILAFDLTYFDVAVDHTREPDGVVSRLGRALGSLLPKPDLVFVLDSEPDVLRHQTQEVSTSELVRQRHARRALARQLPAGHVVDGSLPLSAVVDEIQRVIRAWMLNRSVASLGEQAPIVTAPTASAVGSSGAPTSVSRGDGAR